MCDMSYKDYMEAVKRLIDEFDINDYRNYVLGMAKDLQASERMNLIRTLENVHKYEDETIETEIIQDGNLIENIQALCNRVDNYEYSHGYGWDPEYGGEREMGDESWAEEADEFFESAKNKAQGREYKLARKAYEMLFDMLESDSLPCYECPTEMLKIDLRKHIGLYFRTIYMTTNKEERVEEIYDAVSNLFYIVSDLKITLKNMLESDTYELPNIEEFLNDWIALLMIEDGAFVGDFVTEGVFLKGGIEELQVFAKENHKRFPAAYRELVFQLEKNHAEDEDIIAAAKEGLDKIDKNYIVREEIAQILVRFGKKINDGEIIAEGMREAIISRPSLRGIIEFMKFEKSRENEVNSVLDLAIKREKELKSISRRDSEYRIEELRKTGFSKNLLNQLYLLSGKIEEAYELCKDEKIISTRDDMSNEILTISLIFKLLSKNNFQYHFNIDSLWNDNLNKLKNRFYSTELEHFFVNEFNLVVNKTELNSVDIRKYSQWCIELVSLTADYIVSNQYRDKYDNAALLLTCCAEMLVNTNLKKDGLSLINNFRNKYPRHRNFIGSLRETVGNSGLV